MQSKIAKQGAARSARWMSLMAIAVQQCWWAITVTALKPEERKTKPSKMPLRRAMPQTRIAMFITQTAASRQEFSEIVP
jgi:predicted branched-subunit amino acid permease